MITANEARELVNVSKNRITTLVEGVCKDITETAKMGGSSVYPTNSAFYIDSTHSMNAVQKLAAVELKKLGFSVDINVTESDRSKGFGYIPDDNSPVPDMVKSYNYIVRW